MTELVFSREICHLCTPLAPSIYEVTRAKEIDQTIGRIVGIGLSWAERRAIIGLLCDRRTHQQMATTDGIDRQSSRQRMKRARKRAREHGIEIPKRRLKTERRSLAELRK